MVKQTKQAQRDYHYSDDANIHRIVVANKMRKHIQDNNYTFIRIPEKKLYHIPGKPFNLRDAHYLVLAQKETTFPEKINEELLGKLSLEEHCKPLDELFDLITAIGFHGAHYGNLKVVLNADATFKEFVILDTEARNLEEQKKHFSRGTDQHYRNKLARRGLVKVYKKLRKTARIYWKARMKEWEKAIF